MTETNRDKLSSNFNHRASMMASVVCFADILGYKSMTLESLKKDEGDAFLRRLKSTLETAYAHIRVEGRGYFQMKVFTDNLVVGYTIQPQNLGHGEPELGDAFMTFARFQMDMIRNGFMVRGGIAFGDHYMDEDVVFGPALIEAAAQDQSGGVPRISLATSAIQRVKQHIQFYATPDIAPQCEFILKDRDGVYFLNYLSEAFSDYYEGAGIDFSVLDDHKVLVEDGLEMYESNSRVRVKYEWAAEYHNFICNDLLQKIEQPSSNGSEACRQSTDKDDATRKLSELLISVDHGGFSRIWNSSNDFGSSF